MTNSADPDQLASSEANWSGSALFAKAVHNITTGLIQTGSENQSERSSSLSYK